MNELKQYFDYLGDEVGIFLTDNFVKKYRVLLKSGNKIRLIESVFKNGRLYEYNNKKSKDKKFTIEYKLNKEDFILGIPFVIKNDKKIITISAKDIEDIEYNISKSNNSIASPFSSKKIYVGNPDLLTMYY